MKRCLIPLLLLLLLLAGCGEPAQEPKRQESMEEPMAADHSRWQQEPYYILQFNMDSVISNAPSAAASSSRVVLSQGGTYLLSGTLEDAQLVLDAPAGETVRLVLRGVNMHFEHGPVILSKGTGTVVLVLEDGTENTITDGRTYLYTTAAAGQEAVVSTGGDLLITGEGSLSVQAAHNDAVCSRGTLCMAGGNVTVTAWRNGFIGEKSLTVSGGRLSATCGDTGLSASGKKTGSGELTISGGVVTLFTGGNGAAASGVLSVTGGETLVVSGGGSENRSYGEGSENWGVWGGLPQQTPQQDEEAGSPEREVPVAAGAHGLTSGKTVNLSGGALTLDCSDAAVHSDGMLLLSGSTVTVSGGDTAFAAQGKLTLSAGNVTVLTARRGITAGDMTVSGGSLSISAVEQGLVLSDDIQSEEAVSAPDVRRLTVTDGLLSLRCGGNAAEIAGSLFQSGGTLLLGSGREQTPLRCTVARVSGGTLLAAGYLPQNAEVYTGLPRIGVELWLTGGRPLTVTAAGESEPLLTFTPETSVGHVTLISDKLEAGATYYLISGSARIGVTPE